MPYTYFSEEKAATECQKALIGILSNSVKKISSKYLNPENTNRFKHGGKWAHPANPNALVGGMKKHSSDMFINFEQIINNDLSVIKNNIAIFERDMEDQFLRNLYSTVSDAAIHAGNVVNATSNTCLLEFFISLLEKIEFSVDKYGEVKLPEIHVSPEGHKKLVKSVLEASPEMNERIKEVKNRKSAEALEKEALRKSKFSCYGDHQ